MKLVSFGQSKIMCDKDVETWNCSDAAIIPNAIKTPIKDQHQASYCIANKHGQTAYVYCLTTHELDKETILVPQWVMNKLSLDTDKVVLKTCKLDSAKHISIRLFSKEDVSNDELHKGLSRYAHVQSNTIITLNIKGKEIHLKVEKTEPNKDFVTLRDANVFVEFLEKSDTFLPFYGQKAHVIGGSKPEGKKPAEMAREAALRRIALLEASKSETPSPF
jgi:hypothetical protein